MKRTRFAEEQIIGILKEAEAGAKTAAGGHDAGQFGIEGSAVRKMVTPAAMREAVAHLQASLGMSERRARRRAMGARAAPPVLALPNQRWSLDFVHDQMASGRRFRVLNIVDGFAYACA